MLVFTRSEPSGEVQDHQEHHRDDQEQLQDHVQEGFNELQEGFRGAIRQSSPPSRVIPEILKTSNGLFQKPSRSTDTRLRPVTGIILERLLT